MPGALQPLVPLLERGPLGLRSRVLELEAATAGGSLRRLLDRGGRQCVTGGEAGFALDIK